MNLFESYSKNGLSLQNRVVMCPLTRSRAINNLPNALMAEYYGQRSGAGLIITEGTAPSPNAVGYPRIPGVYSQEQTEAWKPVADAVQAGGSRIFMQLMHVGRVAHPANLPEGAEVVAPSAVELKETQMYVDAEGGTLPMPAPRALETSELPAVIQEYVSAAQNTISAGFDGVELHGANGYLLEQFLNPHTNLRTDEYGGSIENRSRFVLEVAQAVVKAIGAEKVGMRLSPYGVFNEMPAYDEIDATYQYLAQQLSELGLTYVHLADMSAMGAPEVPQATKDLIRKHFNGTLILSGGYDKARAQADLEAGRGDLVAFGRPFLANPDLVERMKQDAPLNEPDYNTFYTPGPEGYTDYPKLEAANV